MNTHTDITTAARRIAREVNATHYETRIWFAADGTVLDRTPAGMWYIDPADEAPAVVILRGTRRTNERLTQREAQDRLDAALAHPGDLDEQGYYLERLDWDRRQAAR